METFTALLKQIGQIFTWWFCVAPWEQAIRVRSGKRTRLLSAGIYLRIPFIDRVYVQSVRRRVSPLQLQTVVSKDGKVFSVCGAISFAVADIEKLYATLHHAEDTVRMLGMLAIAKYVAALDSALLSPISLGATVTADIRGKFEAFGLCDCSVEITDFATTRTYRLLMDQKWGAHGNALDVEKAAD